MSKILYLMMLLLIFDAMNYMRKYYSDDSFDNNAIDGNLKSFWEKEKKSSLTPLRNWELTSYTYGGKYHMAKSLMITYDETIGIILAFIPVLISASFIMAIYFADVSFATVSCCKSIHLCYCKIFPHNFDNFMNIMNFEGSLNLQTKCTIRYCIHWYGSRHSFIRRH